MARRIEIILFLSLLISKSLALQVLNISRFTFVNSLYIYANTLVVATDGGVVIYDIFPKGIRNSLVTENPVQVALRDPLTREIYFVSRGELFKWNPFMTWYSSIGHVGNVTSMAADAEYLYLEENGSVSKYTKSGSYLGKVSPNPKLSWAGRRGEIEKNDPLLVYLSPFFIESSTMGKIEYSVFVRDQDATRLWVGTRGAGILLFSTQTWLPIDSISFGALPRPAYSLFQVNDSLWIGGAEGLTLKVGETWISFSKGGVFEMCEEIRDLTGDSNIIWALTDCGLLKYQDFSFQLNRISNITHVESIEANSPYLWIGGSRGIGWMPISGGRVSWLQNSSRLEVQDIVAAPRNVYALTLGGTLVFNKKTREWKALEDPREWSLALSEVGSSRGDTVLLATERGIIEFIDGRNEFAYLSPPFSPNRVPINALTLSDKGLFLATNSGIYMLDRKTQTWRRYGVQDGLADDRVYSLWATGDTLYAATAKGVTILIP